MYRFGNKWINVRKLITFLSDMLISGLFLETPEEKEAKVQKPRRLMKKTTSGQEDMS